MEKLRERQGDEAGQRVWNIFKCVCHGLSGGVSASHDQGQVACRHSVPAGSAQHKNSASAPTDPPARPFFFPLRCSILPS